MDHKEEEVVSALEELPPTDADLGHASIPAMKLRTEERVRAIFAGRDLAGALRGDQSITERIVRVMNGEPKRRSRGKESGHWVGGNYVYNWRGGKRHGR